MRRGSSFFSGSRFVPGCIAPPQAKILSHFQFKNCEIHALEIMQISNHGMEFENVVYLQEECLAWRRRPICAVPFE
jgi:hypothetical protein